jgi:hypothetical protein
MPFIPFRSKRKWRPSAAIFLIIHLSASFLNCLRGVIVFSFSVFQILVIRPEVPGRLCFFEISGIQVSRRSVIGVTGIHHAGGQSNK